MTPIPRTVVALVLLGGGVACAPPDGEPLTLMTSLDQPDLLEADGEEEVGAPFPSVSDSAAGLFLGDTAVVLADPVDATVHWVARDQNSSVVTVGGFGDGPGEFRSIGGLATMADTVFVSDPARGGVHLFSLPGLVLITFRLWEAESRSEGAFLFTVSPPAGIWPLVGGRAIALPNRMLVAGSGGGSGLIREEVLVPLVLLALESARWRVPTRLIERHQAVVLRVEGRAVSIVPAVQETEMIATFPTGEGFVYLSQTRGSEREPAQITVTWYDALGSERAARDYRMSASGYSNEELWGYAHGALVRPEGALLPSAVRSALSDHGLLPRFRLRVADVRADQSGRLWLRIAGPEEGTRWIVLDRSGRVIGQVSASEGTVFLGALGPAVLFGRPEGDGYLAPERVRIRLESPENSTTPTPDVH